MRPSTRPLPAACLLTITAQACAPGQPAPLPLPDDHLIIAIADEYGHLDPIARFADGLWDRPPWATSFGLERFAAVPSPDSADWRWPDGRRMWAGPGRQSDTLGYAPGPVAVNVPDEWHFYSDSFPHVSLGTLGLQLSSDRTCGYSWSVRTQDGWSRRLPTLGDFRTAGVALSRRPSAILTADARPDVERILEEIGRRDGEPAPRYDPRFIWLGIFQFDDTTIGVLHRLGYGLGLMHAVIELHGDSPRVVAEVAREPC
ncbi:MAG: hypothetical protein OXI71_12290 [Gemmatimonadota bacterium]|nr:hypothetical protein [Gemmatimonadota bacterium]